MFSLASQGDDDLYQWCRDYKIWVFTSGLRKIPLLEFTFQGLRVLNIGNESGSSTGNISNS